MSIPKRVYLFFPLACCLSAFSQTPTAPVEVAKVESRSSARTVPLTAELTPFLQTDIEARSPGYVEKVLVDRGSLVHRGNCWFSSLRRRSTRKLPPRKQPSIKQKPRSHRRKLKPLLQKARRQSCKRRLRPPVPLRVTNCCRLKSSGMRCRR